MKEPETTPQGNPSSAIKSLADRLSRIPQIANLSDERHNEPWTLAISLASLAEAGNVVSRRIESSMIPGQLEGDDLLQAVLDLSTELQHVLYHLEDPRFLRRLFKPLRDEWELKRG